jgi:hypothetical protein
MPNSGRCEFVYLCAGLNFVSYCGDGQFGLVLAIAVTQNAESARLAIALDALCVARRMCGSGSSPR